MAIAGDLLLLLPSQAVEGGHGAEAALLVVELLAVAVAVLYEKRRPLAQQHLAWDAAALLR